MDLNLVMMSGRLAIPPETIAGEEGPLSRLLLTVKTQRPHARVDLIPVLVGTPLPPGVGVGDRLFVCGTVQRRFTGGAPGGARTRVEVVAGEVEAPSLFDASAS